MPNMGVTTVREVSPRRKRAWAVIDSPHDVPRPSSASENTVREATLSGFKNAMIAGAVASGPVLIGCRVIPWAKANLNYTAQALLVSAASISAFFITADKTILERAKQNSIGRYDKPS